MSESELTHLRLASLGAFYPLDIYFEGEQLEEQLAAVKDSWQVYNKSKPKYRRHGLSLFSLDGGTSGEIDLNSVKEYNELHGTKYNELSFRTATPHWSRLHSISQPLKDLQDHLGRSHLIRFEEGGFFPPHRDNGDAFRLIAFFHCDPSSLHFVIDDQKKYFETETLYYANTRLAHSVFSFRENATLLVLNVEPSAAAESFVMRHLREY